MDSFTHLLVVLSLYILYNKVRNKDYMENKSLLFLIITASLAPDLDFLLMPIAISFPQWFSFLGHRQFTHTFLGAPLFGLFIFIIVKNVLNKVYFKEDKDKLHLQLNSEAMLLLVATGWIHAFLDIITNMGVAFFFPFINTRYYLGLFHYMSLVVGPVSLFAALVFYWKRLSKKIHYLAAGYLTYFVVIFLLMMTFANIAQSHVSSIVGLEGIKTSSIATRDPFKWRVYWVETKEGSSQFRYTALDLRENNVSKSLPIWSYPKFSFNSLPAADNDNKALELMENINKDQSISIYRQFTFFISYNFVSFIDSNGEEQIKAKVTVPKFVAVFGPSRGRGPSAGVEVLATN